MRSIVVIIRLSRRRRRLIHTLRRLGLCLLRLRRPILSLSILLLPIERIHRCRAGSVLVARLLNEWLLSTRLRLTVLRLRLRLILMTVLRLWLLSRRCVRLLGLSRRCVRLLLIR